MYKYHYYQVDLEELTEVTGIITQGHPWSRRWVELFKILVSDDGIVWGPVIVPLSNSPEVSQGYEYLIFYC